MNVALPKSIEVKIIMIILKKGGENKKGKNKQKVNMRLFSYLIREKRQGKSLKREGKTF